MPSIYQLRTRQQAARKSAQSKHSAFTKWLGLVVVLVGTYLIYGHSTETKITKIPDDIYATSSKSFFGDLFASSYKKVIWFGADCPLSHSTKKNIDLTIKQNQLDKYYVHRPFLQSSLHMNPTDKLGSFIMENCGDCVCIIVPADHTIIQTTEDYLFRDMIKFQDS